MLCFLVSQAVSAPSILTDPFLDLSSSLCSIPSPALSWGLTSGAEVSVPIPNPSISIFGDSPHSSDDLFSSHSAFQNSDLLLHSSLHLEILLVQLIFPLSLWLSRVWDPFLPRSSLSGAPVQLGFPFSHSPLFSCFLEMSWDSCHYWSLGSSASDSLLFCASCLSCRCVFFVVFVGEGECVPLLFHHLASHMLILFYLVAIFNFYSLRKFQLYNTGLSAIVIMLYVRA